MQDDVPRRRRHRDRRVLDMRLHPAMSRASRDKGKRGEREVRDLLREHGFEARRDGRLDDDLAHDAYGYHFEVKRRETIALPEWTRQAEEDAGDREPVVAYRASHEPWRASLRLDTLVRLIAIEREARSLLDALEGDGPLGLPPEVVAAKLDELLRRAPAASD